MNPPFSLKSWGFEDFTDGDPYDRFGYGMPPADNGDYAWMQHVTKSLKPDGRAIIVMSQGILFRGQPKLTEAEDGRNKKADDEYLIRSGFLRDDLIEAVIVLPSGIFYGNNVPACLAIINKRKPDARKNRVLMIWASRDYQHSTPQCLLRRADCLRILVPWRAYGDAAEALAILPAEGQAILDEISHDRAHGLKGVSDAYDSVLVALPVLREEAESLSPIGLKMWQEVPDAVYPAWGKLHALTEEIARLEQKKSSPAEIKVKKDALKTLTKAARNDAKGRLRIVRGQIRALEKLENERDERIAAVNRRADRETVEVNEALADLRRICADPDEVCRYFVVGEQPAIKDNEYNLNLPRYVDTFSPEEQIDLWTALAELSKAENAVSALRSRLQSLLRTEAAAQ
jgi:type I restriction enzyme M protein